MGQHASRENGGVGASIGAAPVPQVYSSKEKTKEVSDRLVVEIQSRKQQVLAAEKELRGRLFEEYKEQLRELEPSLRLRGEMMGESLVTALTSDAAASLSYADILERSLKNTPMERLPVREVMKTLDPLITPVLNPFVEGMQAPINQAAGELRTKMVVSWVVTGVACGAAGFLLGRLLPRWDSRQR